MPQSRSNVEVEETDDSSLLEYILQIEEELESLTEAIADLQSMTIPPPRAPPALPSMVHHLQVIEELKALFIQSNKQQNKKDTVERLTVFSSFTTGSMEALPTCGTIHQPNIQSIMNQSAVTITRQSTVIDSGIKAGIRTDQSTNLSTTQSHVKPFNHSYHTIMSSFNQSFLKESLLLSSTASIIAADIIRDSLILIFDPGGGYIQS
jgi:hypothetical protein